MSPASCRGSRRNNTHRPDSAEFVAAKKALAGISTETTAQADGSQTQSEIRRLSTKEWGPADRFTTYEHGAFLVDYPADWQVTGDRNTALTIYPKGATSAETVAYGTILSAFTPGRGGNNLEEATRHIVASMRDTNPGLRQAGNPVSISVNGRPAKSVELVGTSAVRENNQPLPERIRLVALQGKNGIVLYMVFIAPGPDFDSLRPVFDRIMRSFVLRD